MTSILPIIAACGTDSGPGQLPQQPPTEIAPVIQQTPASQMPATFRPAYIAAVQKDAPAEFAAIQIDRKARLTNSSMRFVATVDGGGLLVEPTEEAWHLSMRATAVGCEGAVETLGEVDPTVEGNRVELNRNGVAEWYLNGPLGVEQGFVLHEAPKCAGQKIISLAVDGDVSPVLENAGEDGLGDGVFFVDGEGNPKLAYTDLYVTDAEGKKVPAQLSVAAGEVRIVVDDTGAKYPLAIDPLIWVQQQRLAGAGAAPYDNIGSSIAISGDTIAIGASGRDCIGGGDFCGSVFVFVRAGTTWTQQAELRASDNAAVDVFGASVAIDGDTIAVGAPLVNVGALADAGAVYVYTRSGTTWTEQQKVTAATPTAGDQFGYSVAVRGNRLAAGAPTRDSGGVADSGAVFAFQRSGTTWSQVGNALTATMPQATAQCGWNVALISDTLVMGCPSADPGGLTDAGGVKFFTTTADTWTFVGGGNELPGGMAGEKLGLSVAVSPTPGGFPMAVLGAPAATINGNANQGKAYLATRNGGTWLLLPAFSGSANVANSGFGTSVAMDANLNLLIGAQTEVSGSDGGVVYTFKYDAGTGQVVETQILTGAGVNTSQFGHSIALSGDTAAIGSWYDPNTFRGAGYAFVLRKTNGDACAAAGECASGFCADGVCCNTACGGGAGNDCQACSVAAGATTNGTCAPIAAGTECRASAGGCDSAEACDGSANDCPADTKAAAGTFCRLSAGPCDATEACDGASDVCPDDQKSPAGTLCRPSIGDCDAPETCEGTSDECPADMMVPAGTLCRSAAGACDAPETCDGAAQDCPADAKSATGTVCRFPVGACDAAETCDGAADDCPADAKLGADMVCRPAAGACDATESCDGTADECPADTKLAAGTVCRDATQACDAAETCDGTANDCAADINVSDGAACPEGICIAGVCEPPAIPAGGGCECRTAGTAPTTPSRAPLATILFGLLALRRRASKQ